MAMKQFGIHADDVGPIVEIVIMYAVIAVVCVWVGM